MFWTKIDLEPDLRIALRSLSSLLNLYLQVGVVARNP